jgi:hypothetical protein
MQAWSALGFGICSINTVAEADALRGQDLAGVQLIKTADAGVQGPLVLPLLQQVQADFAGRTIVLTRSDIFPAVQAPDFVDHILRVCPAAALAREDAAIIEAYGFGDRAACRARIDTFALRPDALPGVIEQLSRWHVAALMQLRGFGWDYLLTAAIASPRVGGRIMDSGVLVHERHETDAVTPAQAAPFIEPLIGMGLVQSATPETVGADFAQAVQAACLRDAALSDQIKALYFKAPVPRAPGSPQAQSVALRIQASAPWAGWNYSFRTLTALADRRFAGEVFSFHHLAAVFASGPSLHHRFAETLLAALFHLACAGQGLARTLSQTYPPEVPHGVALASLMAATREDPVARRSALAVLFATELVDHGIFNPRMFDALMLSCHNDDERGLLHAIHTDVEGLSDVAA